ncbi:unnamed protein product [Euphydryas editha]|uniref:ribonuclease H n=1 Tax=Euphydryas editha TaxID=104508 RepID=A0AAU9U1Q6_EUPED|nr:unnamed protein product [Euphydryas editha]
MESEMCIPPLKTRRLYLCYKYCLKVNSFSDSINTQLLDKLYSFLSNRFWLHKKKPLPAICHNEIKQNAMSSSFPLEMFTLDTWVSNINLKTIIYSRLDSITGSKSQYPDHRALKCEVLQELQRKYNGYHAIFTDASKTAHGLGTAYYDPKNKNYKLHKIKNKYVSIMTAELFAVSQALCYAFSLNIHKIVIFTDSQSALMHIVKSAFGFRGMSTAYKILDKINRACSKNLTIVLQWVPSHIGLSGNEEADKLAKKAIFEGEEANILPRYSEVLRKYKRKCYNIFKEYFDERSLSKGIWYRTIQCEPPRIPWFYATSMNRQQVVSACRLRAGHMPVKSFAYLMRKVDSPNCDHCNKRDDVYHRLIECVRYADKRNVLFTNFKLNINNVGVLQSVLADPKSDAAKMLFNMFIT